MSRLARRYARALFEVSHERGAVDAVATDLQKIDAELQSDRVRALVLDPDMPRARRFELVEKIIAGGHELTANLLGVMLKRRREAILPDIGPAFDALVREQRGEVRGMVESAAPLADEALRELEKAMSAAVGKTVSLTVDVVPDLLGGVRVRVGNTLFDGTVKAQLEELERRLMEVPIP